MFRLCNNQGFSYQKIGEDLKALECYNEALEINPKDADTWNNKGIILAELGRHQKAIDSFVKSLESIQKIVKHGTTKVVY
jgi:tetratricopeptide (TPR) repeat protein